MVEYKCRAKKYYSDANWQQEIIQFIKEYDLDRESIYDNKLDHFYIWLTENGLMLNNSTLRSLIKRTWGKFIGDRRRWGMPQIRQEKLLNYYYYNLICT